MLTLAKQLMRADSLEKKMKILDSLPIVQEKWKNSFSSLSFEDQYICKQLIVIGQLERVWECEKKEEMLAQLQGIDRFYAELGGLIGYQASLFSLLKKEKKEASGLYYHSPCFLDISHPSSQVNEMVLWGLASLPHIAEIYPLGGAADRLHLVDEETGMELPAGKLPFAGRTLFEGLIRDLVGREYLYYKLYGKQIVTPIAAMTSWEKDNHRHVLEICQANHWFGRPPESFRLFAQPLAPVVNREGQWCRIENQKLMLKPGGHGALWKLARDEGIFAWAASLYRTHALIRQINNPLAGLDHGLLAFTGYGWHKKMKFGFASCPRLVRSAEGVNVLIEKKGLKRSSLVLTNIEYCDFQKFGVEDCPLKEGEPYSRFSSNTNILFADLKAVQVALKRCPYPGLLVNFKKEEGTGRLESTMQNIADVFTEPKKEALATKKTFITYNHRHKTISTAKKAYVEGRPLQETPENCFYDLLFSHREILRECGFSLPSPRTLEEYLKWGPEALFLFAPALGPLYSILRQKLRGGRLEEGSELQLEIADLYVENLQLAGSLCIKADQVVGHLDEAGRVQYSHRTGQCYLKNVRVSNEGVDWSSSAPYWKNRNHRKESVEIILRGHSLFIAENIEWTGSHRIEVADGECIRAVQKGSALSFERAPLPQGPFWTYRLENGEVRLEGNLVSQSHTCHQQVV